LSDPPPAPSKLPAWSDYCFLKASSIHPVPYAAIPFLEQASEVKGNRFFTSLLPLPPSDGIDHIAMEIRTQQKGDRYGSSKDQIEEAAAQACLRHNGLIELFSTNRNSFGSDHKVPFLPVVFTTASLFTSDADIGTGNISLRDVALQSKDWIFDQVAGSRCGRVTGCPQDCCADVEALCPLEKGGHSKSTSRSGSSTTLSESCSVGMLAPEGEQEGAEPFSHPTMWL
jgi:hypothetical protein